jgi:ParB family transcriptional regulator, chromosome partitioning protein
VFAAVGKLTPESFRSNRLPLLKLPEEILKALRQGQIEYTKARAIARLGEAAQRQALLERAIAENLSLSEIRKQIQQLTSSRQGKAARKKPALEKRIDTVYDRIKEVQLWKDGRKQKRLETLLGELEQLLDNGD